MSQTIDSRVVEMKFDNKNFEKNVAESMKTLENLDKRLTKLENTDVHLDKIGKAADSFDLSKIDKALDSITHRFSVMGQVGASVIHNLTTDAYNMVKVFGSKAWDSVFGQIKSGGKSRAKNIAEAQFRIEGLGLNYEDYKQSIDDAVTGTAYGFDEAAVAASQFASSGVKAGEEMDHALRGISGMAAMTGRSYTDLAGVMEDAAAAGKVTNDTFSRLAERGLAALQEYAKRTGKSVDEVRKEAQKGQIAFAEFAKVMDEAYGEHATKADETFTGVTSNIRAQLSRIGQAFYEPLITNNSDLIKMFQSVKAQIKELKKYTDPLAKSMSDYVLKLSRWGKGVIDGIDVSKIEPVFQNAVVIFDNLTKSAENFYSNILKPFGKQFKAAFYEVFPSLNTGKGLLVTISDKLVDVSQRFREFTASIGLFGEKGASVGEVIKVILSGLKAAFSVISSLTVALKPLITLIGTLAKVLIPTIGNLLSGTLMRLPGIVEIGSNIIAGIITGMLSGATLIGNAVVTLGRLLIDVFCSFFGIHSPSRLMMVMIGVPIVAGIAAGIILGKDKILEAIDVICEVIKAGMEKAVDLLFTPFSLIKNKLKGPFEIFATFVKNTSIFRVLSGAFKLLAGVLELFNVVISRTINSVMALDSAGFNKMLNNLKGFIITLVTMLSLNKMSKAINAFGIGINSIGESISTGLKTIATSVKAYAKSRIWAQVADIFKSFALAVGVITASILVMGYVIGDPKRWDSIQKSLMIIGGIMVALIAIVATFGTLSQKLEGFSGKNLTGLALAFVGIGGAIFLVASAVRKVGRLDWTQIGTAFIGIVGLVVAVGVAINSFQKHSNGVKANDNYKLITSFGVTVWLLATAVKKIALLAIFDPAALKRATISILSIVGIFGIIAVAMEALSKLKYGEVGNMGMIKEMPLTFISIGIAVNAIASAIKKISKIPEKDLERSFDRIETIMLIIAAIVGLAHFAQAAVSHLLYSIAAVVVACGLVIGLLGSLENEYVIERGFDILKRLGKEILLFVGVLQLINRYVGGGDSDLKTLLYISAIIVAVTGMIGVISLIDDPKKAWGALGILTVFGVELLGFLYVMQKIMKQSTQLTRGDLFNLHKDGKKGIVDKIIQFGEIIKIINTIVNSIAKLSITLAIVSKVVTDWKQLARAIVILGTVMVPVLGTLLLLDNIDTGGGENIKGLAKAIASITAMILVISGSLLVLSQMPLGSMFVAGMEMASLLSVMAIILDVAKEAENKKINYKALTAAAIAIAAIGASLWAITYFNQGEGGTARVLAATLGLAACIAAIGLALKMASKFNWTPKTGGALAIASLSLLVAAGAIAGLAYFVDDMSKVPTCMTYLGLSIIAIGAALKIAETTTWKAVAGLAAGALALLGVAYSLSMIAGYSWQEMLPSFMALVGIITIMSGIMAALSLLADTGVGALGIGVAAGAILALGLSLMFMAEAMDTAIGALSKFIIMVNPTTASNIVGFFETIGEGIGTAGTKIAEGIKTAVVAFRENMGALKQETASAGTDVVLGFASGMLSSKGLSIVGLAAAALGVAAIAALRGPKGLNCGTPSHEAMDVGKDDVDGGLGLGISEHTELATNPAAQLGLSVIDSLKGSIVDGLKSTDFKDIWTNVKDALSWDNWSTTDKAGLITPGSAIATTWKKIWGGIGGAFGKNAVESVQNGIQQATTSAQGSGNGLMDMFTGLFGGLTSGNFDNVLGGFDWTTLLGGDGISGLKDYLGEAGVSMDNLSGDNIPKLIEQLRGAGLAGDDLINALKELGITEDQLQNLGLADKLGLDTAKEGAEELKTTIEDLADEIINGKFGNAPERWDRMFEALIKSGKTAEEAYAAIADAQNEVNKRLGNSTVHTAEEMSKKVSDAVKKANQAQADANAKGKGETGKSDKDFKKDPHKGVTDINTSQANKSAEEQMKRNMPYANYMAAKEHQITGEREKQTAEAMKQKLANEHMYTLKEKEQAMTGLKANQEIANHATLTAEKQKQLDAENRKYQAVVDTYNKQQEMLKVIQEQEAATKKAEEAEKKRGEAAAKATSGVQYGSAEYEKQKKGTTINNRKTIVKPETKPVQAETKVEMTPKLEVKNIDVSQYKEQIVAKVESQVKELNTKVDITPKINTSQAETQIANFKQKTQELKTSIPQTFEGIAQKVSEHFTKISSMVITGGGKLTANTRSVFQNAVAAATGVLTGSETISKFYNAGKQATDGYVRGMKANLASVKSASNEIAALSANSIKKKLQIKSPSRVFMSLGGYAGEGFVIGLNSYTNAVDLASSNLAQSSIDSIYRVVDTVQNAVSNGMDITPTITPVFDAGNIQNELGNFNSMMDFSQRDIASITANIDAKASYDNSQVEAMQSRMSDMQNAFNNLADILNNQPTPEVNANVILQGDADGVFKLMRNSDSKYKKMHGKSAFA